MSTPVDGGDKSGVISDCGAKVGVVFDSGAEVGVIVSCTVELLPGDGAGPIHFKTSNNYSEWVDTQA